jgi:hypothetical protein
VSNKVVPPILRKNVNEKEIRALEERCLPPDNRNRETGRRKMRVLSGPLDAAAAFRDEKGRSYHLRRITGGFLDG